MRHLASLTALTALLALTAATTESEARGRRTKATENKKHKKAKKAKKHTKVEAPAEPSDDEQIATDDVEEQDEAVDADDEDDRPAKKRKKARKVRVQDEDADDDDVDEDEDRVAFEMRDDGDELVDDVGDEDEPLTARKHSPGKERDWHVSIGPYLWASAVDADVSIGSAKLGATIDFGDMTKHARYGVPLIGEIRYKRISLYTDFMYGVVDVHGQTELGPLMVDIKGTAKNLLMDNFLGVTVLGASETAQLSVEPRVGLRYQRTAISGAVDVEGNMFGPPGQVTTESDALVGGRVIFRPWRKLALIGVADGRIFGSSVSTWSATVEANYKITSYVQAALAYRTLTTDSAQVGLEMYGPRLTIQATF